jgi:molecular chaperone GrpE (heat shock protein)
MTDEKPPEPTVEGPAPPAPQPVSEPVREQTRSQPPPAEVPHPPMPERPPSDPTAASSLRTSTLYRLCEEVVALRERCDRQHREFEKSLARTQTAFQTAFNSFAADTQRAYQQLRQELNGEKRTTLVLLGELLDIALDMQTIVQAKPATADPEPLGRWAEAVEVQSRKVQDVLKRHSLHAYDAVIGSAYNPALHERVGGRLVEGTVPGRIVEQVEPGYASQQPDFTLRRPKVIVSE